MNTPTPRPPTLTEEEAALIRSAYTCGNIIAVKMIDVIDRLLTTPAAQGTGGEWPIAWLNAAIDGECPEEVLTSLHKVGALRSSPAPETERSEVTVEGALRELLWGVLRMYRNTIGEEALPMVMQDLQDALIASGILTGGAK